MGRIRGGDTYYVAARGLIAGYPGLYACSFSMPDEEAVMVSAPATAISENVCAAAFLSLRLLLHARAILVLVLVLMLVHCSVLVGKDTTLAV